jgi:hypothetical protein
MISRFESPIFQRLVTTSLEGVEGKYGGEDLPSARRGGREYHSLPPQVIENGQIKGERAAWHRLPSWWRGSRCFREKAMFECSGFVGGRESFGLVGHTVTGSFLSSFLR